MKTHTPFRDRFWAVLNWLHGRRRYLWTFWALILVAWVSYDIGRLVQTAQIINGVGSPSGVISVNQVDAQVAKDRGGRIIILSQNSARWIDPQGKVWEVASFSDEVTRANLRRWKEGGVEIQGRVSIDIEPIQTGSKDLIISHLMDMGIRLLMIGVYVALGWFAWRMMKGSVRYHKLGKGSRPDISLGDVAGQEGPKQELMEVVEYLRDPSRFKKAGARPPRGVLLYGPPGTGKTLLAKAIAGEARASFIEQNAASFVRLYAGAGADSVRKLFAEARKSKPCVVFIDEIDAVGGSRGGAGSHDERIQSLNALLAEMDGFADNTGLVVVAATNRLDTLDEALVRPGRFDRKVHVPVPGREDRVAILGLHANKLPAMKANLDHWADQTRGFSGADLAGLVNEAAIEAARKGVAIVGDDEFAKARDRIMLGARDHGRKLSEKDRSFVAHHELGHAVVRRHFGGRVEKVSIQPRAGSLGVTISVAEEEKMLLTPEEVRREICVLMGGRAAEQVFFGTITGGAADDMERASKLAREAIHRYGFDGMGPYVPAHEALLRESELKAASWVKESYEQALSIVESHRGEVDRLARILIEQEELSEAVLDSVWSF